MIGAGKMLQQYADPIDLKNRVCSPDKAILIEKVIVLNACIRKDSQLLYKEDKRRIPYKTQGK